MLYEMHSMHMRFISGKQKPVHTHIKRTENRGNTKKKKKNNNIKCRLKLEHPSWN